MSLSGICFPFLAAGAPVADDADRLRAMFDPSINPSGGGAGWVCDGRRKDLTQRAQREEHRGHGENVRLAGGDFDFEAVAAGVFGSVQGAVGFFDEVG
jgi:hypothetical protein